jgi:mannitol-1-phosphate/altronate dehydrogenase
VTPSSSPTGLLGPATPTPLTGGAPRRRRARLTLPTYDRSTLSPSAVHIGVGGFTRAHQLVYFDEIAERRISTEWGVLGVGLHSRALQDALAPQDYLYLVVERGVGPDRARVIGSLIGYRFAPDDPGAVLAALTAPTTRVVTLTITGNGYRIDPATGEFDPDDAEVRSDLRYPGRPCGALGFLVEALDRRRRAGLPPFTVLSCDNIQRNGRAARTAVVGFARLRDEVLARWIDHHVAFPASMVDRITPRTTEDDRAAVAEVFGIDDRWPVITEPFSQWVVEDDFCHGRPPLDEVGGAVRRRRPAPRADEDPTAERAGWLRYLRGTVETGNPLEVRAPRAPQLQALAVAGGLDPRPVLGVRSIFSDLGAVPSVVEGVAAALRGFERDGVRATVARYTGPDGPGEHSGGGRTSRSGNSTTNGEPA